MPIERETIKTWVKVWIQSNNDQLVGDTKDSIVNNYIQVIPSWLQNNDPYQGWVHYEIINRSEQWFAEFHVELYKCQRAALEQKLDRILSEHTRSLM